tara:strand:+ start:3936 stop:4907 length:972 start_codon:yes stop_codon:yes gene_type:complete
MSLNKHYAIHNLSKVDGEFKEIGSSGTSTIWNDIVEVASPLFEGHMPQFDEITYLYIQAIPTQLGEGDVSLNLQYKDDNEKNNQGCEKWLEILFNVGKIYSTMLSKEDLLRVYTITDDGTIDVYDMQNNEVPEEKVTLNNFLEHFGMDTGRIKVMKEASIDGITYMLDMISFILIMETMFNSISFTSQWVVPEIVKAGDERLTSVEGEEGEIWTPVEGNDYLYFTPSSVNEGVNIMKYNGDKINLYTKLQELLSLEENETKGQVRSMFIWVNIYTRISDIWINGIDGALTFYMLLNAYSHTTLTEDEEKIKSQLEQITSTFFQ